MYLYCHTNDQEYHDLRNLRFAPEYDPTLATLPICQLSADIVTDDTVWDSNGVLVSLYDDIANTFAHGYIVTEHHRANAHVVSIVAKSNLYYLENRVLFPVGYVESDSITYRNLINDALTSLSGEGEIGYEMSAQIDSEAADKPIVGGYAPQQSARERLQWICQAAGLYVKQWGAGVSDDIHICSPLDADSNRLTTNTVIPFQHTFDRPKIEQVHNNRYYHYKEYNFFKKNYSGTSDYYERYTIVEPQKTDDGLEVDGEYIWVHCIERENDSQNGGTGIVANDSNSLLSYNNIIDYSTTVPYVRYRQQRLTKAYCRRYEVTLDVINNGEYWPGDVVKFYVDDTTVYMGVIKSCDFTFGKQTRSRLVISTDLEPVEMGHLRIDYVYTSGSTTMALGRRDYYVPRNTNITIEDPVFKVNVVDHFELFAPQSYPDPAVYTTTVYNSEMTMTRTYKRVRDP